MKNFCRYALLAGTTLGTIVPFTAIAQNSTAPADPVTAQPQQSSPDPQAAAVPAARTSDAANQEVGKNTVEEIIVTANKQQENIQDVPKSVQVVSDEALQRQNIVNIGELQKLVPTISGQGQTLAIRGVGTGASNVNAPNKVGIVLDDIPQPSSTTLSDFLLDVERIEVLPGPQGTLAGRNATGGLINMVTRGPTSEWSGFANLLYSSDEQEQAALFLAGPISETIQVSTSNYYDGFRGLTENIYLDEWSDSYTYGTRNKVKFLATDSFTADLTAFYQYTRINGDRLIAPFAFIPTGTSAACPSGFCFPADIRRRPFSEAQPGVTPSLSNRNFADPINGQFRTTDYGGIARFTYETAGGLTFTSINSYLEEESDRDTVFGLGVIPLQDLIARPEFDGFQHADRSTEYFTSEFRINSPDRGPLHYVAGLFFADERTGQNFERYLFPAVNASTFDTETLAGYAHADYDITEQLTLQGGIRFEKDRVGYRAASPELPAIQKVTSDGVVRSFPRVAPVSSANKDSDSFFNFDVGAQYKVTPDVMFYATFAEAKQGPIYDASAIFGAPPAGGLQTLPQESVEAYEAGVKSQLFNRALTLNISLFHSTYQNYQVQTSVVISPDLPPQRTLASVGKVRTSGVEMNASARLLDNLRADLNLAYTDAEILDFPNAPCYIGAVVGSPDCMVVNAGTPAQFTTQGNLAGNSLNRAPKVRATFTVDYGLPLNDDGLEFFVSPLVKHASSENTDLLGGPTFARDPATYVDINVGVRSDKLTAELFVRNLFDENEQTFIPQQQFSPNGALQQVLERINTRYVGGRVRYSF